MFIQQPSVISSLKGCLKQIQNWHKNIIGWLASEIGSLDIRKQSNTVPVYT